jgi:hypothetical protein
MREATSKRRAKRSPSFAKFIGGRFSPSSATRAIPSPTHRISPRIFSLWCLKVVSSSVPIGVVDDSVRSCSRRCRISCAMPPRVGARGNAVATCNLFPGTNGWRRRHRGCRFQPRIRRAGRRNGFLMCAGRQRWSSARCGDWAMNAKSVAGGACLSHGGARRCFLRQILKDARLVGSGAEKPRAPVSRALSRAAPRRSCQNRRQTRRNRGRTPISVFGIGCRGVI